MAQDNTLMKATVALEIDPSKAIQSADRAAKQLQAKLTQNSRSVSSAMQSSLTASTTKLVSVVDRGAQKVGETLKRAFQVASGSAASSIYLFMKKGTPEALKFANSIDRIKDAWAGVGQKLATKIKFNGKSLTDWIPTLESKLNALDTSKLEQILGYAKAIGVAFATIKVAQLLKFAFDFSKAAKEFGGAIRGLGQAKLPTMGTPGQAGQALPAAGFGGAAAALAGGLLSRPAVVKEDNPIAAALNKVAAIGSREDTPAKRRMGNAVREDRRENAINRLYGSRMGVGYMGDQGKRPGLYGKLYEDELSGIFEKDVDDPLAAQKAFDRVKAQQGLDKLGQDVWAKKFKTEVAMRKSGGTYSGPAMPGNKYTQWKEARGAEWPGVKQEMGKNLNSWGSGAVVASQAAFSAAKLSNGGSGEEWASETAKVAGTVLGTALAGPTGGAIAMALGEIGERIGSSLGEWSAEGGQATIDARVKANRGPMWQDLEEARRKADEEKSRKQREQEDRFLEASSKSMGRSRNISEAFRDVGNQYAGGRAPSAKLNLFAQAGSAPGMIKEFDQQLKDLESTFEGESNSAIKETLQRQIEAVKQQREDMIGIVNSIVTNYREEERAKREFNEKLSDFDEKTADAQKEYKRAVVNAGTGYKNNVADINRDDPFTSEQTSLSMGQDIQSIPAIISQGLNDAKNAQAEKTNEAFQRLIDTDLAALDYQMELVNLAADKKKFDEDLAKERAKYEAEKAKTDAENAKTTADILKTIAKSLGSGSSTVNNV